MVDEHCLGVTIQKNFEPMEKSLHFQIDVRSGLPVYRQLMDQVRYYIASGVLKAGAQLPSIRELAQRLSVNPTTIVKAYSELEHEKVIELRRGKGAFVAEQVRQSAGDCEAALRKSARQLAVEATQLGVGVQDAVRIVREEFAELGRGSASEKTVRLKVVGED